MKNIRIEDSYKIWSTDKMWYIIDDYCKKHDIREARYYLNRTNQSMYREWWLHNIGYYITKPFCFIKFISKINLRCKDVDLEEHK